jgi:hypothetical protein
MLSSGSRFGRKCVWSFRAEAFNLFNWVNFGPPVSNVGDPGFGITSSPTTPPRILQLALKLSFSRADSLFGGRSPAT